MTDGLWNSHGRLKFLRATLHSRNFHPGSLQHPQFVKSDTTEKYDSGSTLVPTSTADNGLHHTVTSPVPQPKRLQDE